MTNMAVVVCPLMIGLLIAVLVPRAADGYRMEPDREQQDEGGKPRYP